MKETEPPDTLDRVRQEPIQQQETHQRQCGQDPSVDGVDRDAGAEVPAVEIVVLLVIIDAGRSAAAATLLLSRSVGVVG
jgi:hypothetical protein